MAKLFDIFKIRREERLGALLAAFFFAVLNILNVVKYSNLFVPGNGKCLSAFVKNFHLAGFDPITYHVITRWTSGYNIYRHPLLAYFMWPFSKINEGLMSLTGLNFATVITAIILVVCATYAFIFLHRIFFEIIGTKRSEGYVLTALTFSFAYILLATMAPDHFCLSMCCLVATLYVSGRKLKLGKALNWWQTILLFIVTAGISLNNGLKVFLAGLVTRRRRFFKPGYLIIAVILPAALMWGSARLSYRYLVWPKEVAGKMKTQKVRDAQLHRLQRQAVVKANTNDTARIAQIQDSVKNKLAEKYKKRKTMSAAYKHTGKPFMQGEFMRWTDMTTNRWDVATECLFGEGIMLHQDYVLGDVLVNRPVIVHYRNWFNYIVEAFLFILFLCGIWYGRRSIFLWTAMSFFLMDMVLHMGMGFGINEISIMSAHYLYVLPIAMAFFLRKLPDVWRKRLTATLAAVTAYLVIWNVTLLVEFMFFI